MNPKGKETLTRFGIAASASRSAYRLVQVAWTVTSRRQLRPIKSTYILQGKESAKARRPRREGETMRKGKRIVEESVEFSSREDKMTVARREIVA